MIPARATLLLFVLATGCARVQPGAGVKVTNLVVDEVLPSVVHVKWASEYDGTAVVQYGPDGALDAATPPTADHEITVLGLKAGGTYDFRVVVTDGDGDEHESETESLKLPPPPQGLLPFAITDQDASRSIGGGYILTSILTEDVGYIVIIDMDGDYVWYREADEGLSVPTTHIGRDHQSILAGQTEHTQTVDLGNVIRIGLSRGDTHVTRANLSHHDYTELPDGNFAWLAYDIRDDIEVDEEHYTITGDAIDEAPEGTAEGDPFVARFNFFDDYEAEPWAMCRHFWAEATNTGGLDWTHSNSLMYRDDEDAFYLMSKNLDALLKIDRQSGAVLWQINGLYSDFQPEDASAVWSHGHMSHLWDGGFMVFDNGYHHDPPRSRLLEIAYDEDTMTFRRVWDYWDPDDRFIMLLGDARKLPNGNYLGSWTDAGMLTEVTPDGTVVWRATLAVGAAVGRVTWVQDLYTME